VREDHLLAASLHCDEDARYIVTPRDLANDSVTGATHYAFVFFNDLVPDAVFVLPEDVIRNGAGRRSNGKIWKSTSRA
jgi:hypothetical protein